MDTVTYLWILIALLTITPLIGVILYLYLIRRMMRKDRQHSGEFLLRFIPGVYGGLFVYICTRLDGILSNGINETTLFNIGWTIFMALFVIIIGLGLYILIERRRNQ